MANQYWGSVRQRISSLGNTIVRTTTPVLVSYTVEQIVERTCRIIESKIKQMYINAFVYSGIYFILSVIGLSIMRYRPFGDRNSLFVASCSFSAGLLIWLLRLCLFIRKYGKTSFEVTRHIFKEKSVYMGIECYTLEVFPVLTLIYVGIDSFSNKIPTLKTIPRIAEFVRYLVKIFWKRIVLFICTILIYTTFLWILKLWIA